MRCGGAALSVPQEVYSLRLAAIGLFDQRGRGKISSSKAGMGPANMISEPFVVREKSWAGCGSQKGRRPRPELRSIRTGCEGLYGSIPCPPNPVYVLFGHAEIRIRGDQNRAARKGMEPAA